MPVEAQTLLNMGNTLGSASTSVILSLSASSGYHARRSSLRKSCNSPENSMPVGPPPTTTTRGSASVYRTHGFSWPTYSCASTCRLPLRSGPGRRRIRHSPSLVHGAKRGEKPDQPDATEALKLCTDLLGVRKLFQETRVLLTNK